MDEGFNQIKYEESAKNRLLWIVILSCSIATSEP